jgi:hypothetical protein
VKTTEYESDWLIFAQQRLFQTNLIGMLWLALYGLAKSHLEGKPPLDSLGKAYW